MLICKRLRTRSDRFALADEAIAANCRRATPAASRPPKGGRPPSPAQFLFGAPLAPVRPVPVCGGRLRCICPARLPPLNTTDGLAGLLSPLAGGLRRSLCAPTGRGRLRVGSGPAGCFHFGSVEESPACPRGSWSSSLTWAPASRGTPFCCRTVGNSRSQIAVVVRHAAQLLDQLCDRIAAAVDAQHVRRFAV